MSTNIDMFRAGGSSAVLSDCGCYRYRLTRTWDLAEPPLVFCMLNPSTADASKDDPTIRRCIGFARREGCGGIVVVNLFAWRSTHPDLLPVSDSQAEGPENREHVIAAAKGRRVVVAYGAHHRAHPHIVLPLLETLRWVASGIYCLGTTKSGAPRHPLYVRADAPLERIA